MHLGWPFSQQSVLCDLDFVGAGCGELRAVICILPWLLLPLLRPSPPRYFIIFRLQLAKPQLS